MKVIVFTCHEKEERAPGLTFEHQGIYVPQEKAAIMISYPQTLCDLGKAKYNLVSNEKTLSELEALSKGTEFEDSQVVYDKVKQGEIDDNVIKEILWDARAKKGLEIRLENNLDELLEGAGI